MDKKQEKYNAPLREEFPDNISVYSLMCLEDNGISTIGQIMDRWEALSCVSQGRTEFQAMLRGLGVRGVNVKHIANFCAAFEYRLQSDRESKLRYMKVGRNYVPVEVLSDDTGMPEGIYLVRTSNKTGNVRSVSSLSHAANEVGWFKIAGNPVLDFELIAKIDYYAEAIASNLSKTQMCGMSLYQLARHLAKIMLEVTENARAGYIPSKKISPIEIDDKFNS